MKENILVTGAAGFIGSFLCKQFLKENTCKVIGVDNLNDYYDVGIKKNRLKMIAKATGGSIDDATPDGFAIGRFSFIKGDIANQYFVNQLFDDYVPDIVVNLAAQAGVRYSIENPDAYVESNLIGFFNILEACRHHPVKHLVYASSSSVYGANTKVPYATDDKTDSPVSLYAATKKANELLAHAYSKLYGIPATGLRFFTVYGPMGRPDMAYFKFTDKIVRGEPIQIYNMGDMKRDFTYIDDIVKGIIAVINKPPMKTDTGAQHAVYNIGNNSPEDLMSFIETLEQVLIEENVIDKPADRELLPMQPGDVYQTYADTAPLERDFGFKPNTPLKDGLREFARWYKEYYRI